MKTQKRSIEIGSVSCATLRPADLIPAFMEVMRIHNSGVYVKLLDAVPGLARLYRDAVANLESGHENEGESGWFESEEAALFLNDDLFDAMQIIAPPYTYFGAHEGDPADFGFWPDVDSLQEDIRQGFIMQRDDLSDPDIVRHTGTVAIVNDHGNLSLYSAEKGKATLIWDCV